MSGQAWTGASQGKLTVRYLIQASLTLVADLLINAMGSSISLPKQVYVLPVLALIVIAIRAIVEYVNGMPPDWPKNIWSRFPQPTPTGNEATLWGRRVNIRMSPIAMLGGLFLFVALWFYYYSLIFFFGSYDAYNSYYSYDQGQNQSSSLLSSVCALVAITLTVLGLFMTIGVRPRMVLSRTGIFIRDNRGKFFIQWNDVTNMYTVRRGLDWLVATFPPNSPMRHQQQWIPDTSQKDVFKICNLTSAGIRGGHVDEALNFWSPFKRARP
jgi:hypothetical protein